MIPLGIPSPLKPLTLKQQLSLFAALAAAVILAVGSSVGVVLLMKSTQSKGAQTMPVGSTPLDDTNHWTTITVENIQDRNGPTLKQIRVKDGWLYVADPDNFSNRSPAMTFVPDSCYR